MPKREEHPVQSLFLLEGFARLTFHFCSFISVTPTSSEAFIVRIYRKHNRVRGKFLPYSQFLRLIDFLFNNTHRSGSSKLSPINPNNSLSVSHLYKRSYNNSNYAKSSSVLDFTRMSTGIYKRGKPTSSNCINLWRTRCWTYKARSSNAWKQPWVKSRGVILMCVLTRRLLLDAIGMIAKSNTREVHSSKSKIWPSRTLCFDHSMDSSGRGWIQFGTK